MFLWPNSAFYRPIPTISCVFEPFPTQTLFLFTLAAPMHREEWTMVVKINSIRFLISSRTFNVAKVLYVENVRRITLISYLLWNMEL